MIHFDDMDLRLFLAVEETGSLTAGAGRAGLSASAASERLGRLETHLGVTLFERVPRGVRLTREGAHFAAFAREVAAKTETLESVLRPYRGTRTAVRIATNVNALETFLPGDLGDYMAAHPEVALELVKFDLNWMLLKAVASGEVDLGVTAYEGTHPELRFADYRSDTLAVVMSVQYPWVEEETGVSFEVFRDVPFIEIGARSALGILLEEHARAYGFTLDVRARVPSYEAALELVARGVGLTVLPQSLHPAAEVAERLAVRPLTDAWAVRRLRLCWKAGSEGMPVVAGLLGALADSHRPA